MIDTAQTLLVEVKPRVIDIVANAEQSARIARAQMERLDATVNDIVDRTRLQVIRADELVNRTMDRVEETTDMVHRTVVSPIRRLSGLVQGLECGTGIFPWPETAAAARRNGCARRTSCSSESCFL